MDIVMWHKDLGMSADEIVAAYPGLSLSDVQPPLPIILTTSPKSVMTFVVMTNSRKSCAIASLQS